jgi:hypothetical protein
LVSLFELNADTTVKGGCDTEYGHKLNLTTDSWRATSTSMAERRGMRPPTAALPRATAWPQRRHGHLRHSLPQEGRPWGRGIRSNWVSRKRRNFRDGIESGISCLKRAYGLVRCTWRRLDHFKPTSGPRSWPTTSSSSLVSANLTAKSVADALLPDRGRILRRADRTRNAVTVRNLLLGASQDLQRRLQSKISHCKRCKICAFVGGH